jgi:hypothetical protein
LCNLPLFVGYGMRPLMKHPPHRHPCPRMNGFGSWKRR